MEKNPVCEMLGIEYPVIQGGMAWIADAKLAAAVSNAGGLGLIAAMNSNGEQLRAQIKEAKKAVEKNLKGGLISNWALLNKAMDELGISSADQKNMSASDWNAVNEKIQELRGSKKKDK